MASPPGPVTNVVDQTTHFKTKKGVEEATMAMTINGAKKTSEFAGHPVDMYISFQ